MGKIKVFTDSCSDLSPELIQKHEISVVSVLVTFGEESLKDGVEITTGELYKRVEEGSKLPKTAAPSPGDFVKAFRPYIEAGDDILYVGLSSGLSSTYQSAVLAATEFPEGRIECVDSQNLSTGIGLVVLKGVDFAKSGMGLKEVAERLREIVPKVETEFVIDTLDYLYKGGRCSGMQNLIGSMLKIRPVVKVVNGKMILADKIRGKRDRVLQTLLERSLVNKERMDAARVFVTHSFGEEDAKFLQGELVKQLPQVKEILITEAGCVISSHCGPNTVGILYITE